MEYVNCYVNFFGCGWTLGTGYNYPVVFRSGLPGNDHHPNITFRVALYLK